MEEESAVVPNYLLPIVQYPEAIKFADEQLKVFWLPDEIKVEKDIQDVLTNFTEAEKHAAITTLKLFSIYETHIGDEWWSGRFKQMFPYASIHRMAAVFSMFELAVHSPFYNKINELLNIDTPEFYLTYLDSPALCERVKYIGKMIKHENDAVALAAFSLIEGVILYSSFAFLKHYQSQGKNKLANVVRGINFSVRDENLHSLAGAWAFKIKTQDCTKEELEKIKELVIETSNQILEHEKQIISMLFEKGKIEGITATQIENFVKSRINECLNNLGFKSIHEISYNPIAEYFYKGINDYQFNDFFAGIGREYNRNWSEVDFVWGEE
jgi:ribonucleotide reductase beta subunit family protein with ferritin-like domain